MGLCSRISLVLPINIFPSLIFSTALIEHLEQKVTPFNAIYRLSSYVRCTNKSMIISSSSGICTTVFAGVRLVCTHLWNVIALVLHIVGFPTDRCCTAVGNCLSSATASCCASREQSLQTMPISSSAPMSGSSGANVAGRGRTLGGLGSSSSLSVVKSGQNGNGGYAQISQEV